MRQFSVLTPTFNRAKYLPRIYDCLCQQDDIDFEWIIVDDGSSDNTREVVSGFNAGFEIKYVYQENGGQVSAWNTGIKNTDSLIVVKIDDDDILYPHALKTVWNYFDSKNGKFEHNCACVSGLCQYDTGEIIGDKFPHDYFISDHIRYLNNKYIDGDKCEFFITAVFSEYPYPILPGEKNIAPGIVFNRIALTHKTLYVNKVFSEKQFLQGGLSTQNYLYKYPFGAELYFNEASIPPFRLKLQIKNSARYIFFAKMNRRKRIFLQAKNKLIFIPGLCAYYTGIIKTFLKNYTFFQNLNDFLKKFRITGHPVKNGKAKIFRPV